MIEFNIAALISGIIGGIFIAGAGYFRAWKGGETFELAKFLPTVILGAIVGGGMGLTGIPLTQENYELQVPLYMGLTIFLQFIFTGLFAKKEEPTLVEGATFTSYIGGGPSAMRKRIITNVEKNGNIGQTRVVFYDSITAYHIENAPEGSHMVTAITTTGPEPLFRRGSEDEVLRMIDQIDGTGGVVDLRIKMTNRVG